MHVLALRIPKIPKCFGPLVFPESVWAKGSSNSGSLSSHLLIFTSSHIFPHPLIFSHLLTSSHLLILSHLHIFSHLLTSSSHIFTSSSHIFTSSPLLTSSHLLKFSHLLIFASSHIFTSSRLHIFSSSHLFIFSHLVIFSHLLSLALLPSCPLALFSLLLFYFSLKARGSANEAPRNATLSHETTFDRQKLRKNCIFNVRSQPFRTKWSSIVKNCDKITILGFCCNPFAPNEVRSAKTEIKLRFWSAFCKLSCTK